MADIGRLAPGELTRLAECVLEPIRFPGAIQPHGVFFALDPVLLTISHVSDNTQRLIGADPVALLGRPLTDVLDRDDVADIRAVLADDRDETNPTATTLGERRFDVITHRTPDRVFVELEPRLGRDVPAIMGTRDVMRRMATAETMQDLWQQTAIGLRKITGYDRVMIYHFHPDGHGEIVGEARADDMEPYLGLHYPASDIPQQARNLYLTKQSRMIGNSGADSATLLSDANQVESGALDLSVAELRAVSPHHLEFMRNMGQASTFSLSLVRNGDLVGMITCAHRTELRLSYNLRDGLEILANQLSLQLGAMVEIDRLRQRDGLRQIRAALLTQVAAGVDLVDSLLFEHVTLLDLVPADGVAVRLNGRLASLGAVPAPDVLDSLSARVAAVGGDTDFVSDAIPLDHPDLVEALPGVAGMLVRRLGLEGDYIAWFRGEIVHTINWLGDMSLGNRQTPLSPRNSFSAWREDVRGTSEPWTGFESESRELSRDLESALLNQARSELADLALRDALTGLANRRVVLETLDQRLAEGGQANGLALLFVDVDRFKSINDEFGHAAGDDALIHVAQSLRSAARAGDLVARLGGDEFVVVIDGVDESEANAIARRVAETIDRAPEDGSGWRVTASIGVALAFGTADASHLLSAADAAMYRAKLDARRGRD